MTNLLPFIFLFLSVFISLLLFIFVFYITIYGHLKGAPFAKSSDKEVKNIFDLLRIEKNQLFYDLGSGDGSILIEAAKRGAIGIGIEINPFLVLFSRIRIKLLGLSGRIKIYRGDFTQFSLKNADIIYFYLLPATIKKLQDKFNKEVKIKTRIISNGIPLKRWKLIKKQNNIFLYRKIHK